MREDLDMPESRAPARKAARWKLAVGAVTVAVASVIAVPVASASVSNARPTAVPVAAAVVARPALHANYWEPVPLWPHWGNPLDGTAVGGRWSPVFTWPHWGGPQTVVALRLSPQLTWPHWGYLT